MRQVNAGLGAHYRFAFDKANLVLKADATFSYDVVRPSASQVGVFGGTQLSTVDPSSVVFSIGADIATITNDATFSFSANTTQFEENAERYGFVFGIRLRF